ncbi:RRQRL motif-containing zinc-binding protein [Streptomyces sp. SM12]|uniref:RRQRL motif-containing zinc-binding protein n=1 Tax=Streptomyces sp. SM12 TaxID=1071602 RepID=UPI000CD4DB50|nr:RRQRL motif-containing zinc-binding protein [Streptomyces sp. SM12]
MPSRRRTLTAVPARVDLDKDRAVLPRYEHGTTPEFLMTFRQLAAAGLRPGGHDPVAVLRCRRCAYHPTRECTRPAALYDSRRALPKRTPTLAQEAALDSAMAARQTCQQCGVRQPHCLPVADRRCHPCATGGSLAAAA